MVRLIARVGIETADMLVTRSSRAICEIAGPSVATQA